MLSVGSGGSESIHPNSGCTNFRHTIPLTQPQQPSARNHWPRGVPIPCKPTSAPNRINGIAVYRHCCGLQCRRRPTSAAAIPHNTIPTSTTPNTPTACSARFHVNGFPFGRRLNHNDTPPARANPATFSSIRPASIPLRPPNATPRFDESSPVALS